MTAQARAGALAVLVLAAAWCQREAHGAPRRTADSYFASDPVRLSTQDKAALAAAQRAQAAGAGIRPVPGPDGLVRFVHGAQQATVVCAVLQVCDIELQAGEQVNNLNVGDTRFTVEPAVSGSGPSEAQHLIVKPLDVGLETSLVVTTSRRTYHIRLRSHRTDFMPRVGFTYPDEPARWDSVRGHDGARQQEQRLAGGSDDLRDLNFGYRLEGTARWKPVRVYDNGVQTVIQMPGTIRQGEAPVLLVVRREGGFLSGKDETVTVNYRVHGDRYIVDNLFDKALLIAGVGSGQERITIMREK